MIRFIAIGVFSFVCFACTDCNAQRPLGLFFRQPAVQQPAFVAPTQLRFHPSQYNQRSNGVLARLLDGPMPSRNRNPVEVDSRYVGGFHRSQLYNDGIPTGDIGLRGNGINWILW